jgi:hypothetical protein
VQEFRCKNFGDSVQLNRLDSKAADGRYRRTKHRTKCIIITRNSSARGGAPEFSRAVPKLRPTATKIAAEKPTGSCIARRGRMPDRTTLTSTVLATVLAGMALMSAACSPARAADGCLRAPSHQASTGRHWYYRLERQTHRRCWYLAEQGHRTHRAASATPRPSARMNLQRAIERIRQSNADARAELAAPRDAERPDHPAPLRGNPVLNSAPLGESDSATTNAVEQALADATPELLPAAASLETAARLPADETATSPFRLTLSLLLMAMGLAAVMVAVIFKRADPVPARCNDAPLPMHDAAGELEQVLDERASLRHQT